MLFSIPIRFSGGAVQALQKRATLAQTPYFASSASTVRKPLSADIFSFSSSEVPRNQLRFGADNRYDIYDEGINAQNKESITAVIRQIVSGLNGNSDSVNLLRKNLQTVNNTQQAKNFAAVYPDSYGEKLQEIVVLSNEGKTEQALGVLENLKEDLGISPPPPPKVPSTSQRKQTEIVIGNPTGRYKMQQVTFPNGQKIDLSKKEVEVLLMLMNQVDTQELNHRDVGHIKTLRTKFKATVYAPSIQFTEGVKGRKKSTAKWLGLKASSSSAQAGSSRSVQAGSSTTHNQPEGEESEWSETDYPYTKASGAAGLSRAYKHRDGRRDYHDRYTGVYLSSS